MLFAYIVCNISLCYFSKGSFTGVKYTILASYDSYSKLLQTGWLIELYSLTVWKLEVWNQDVSKVASFLRLWG